MENHGFYWKNVFQVHTGAAKVRSFWRFLDQKSAQSRHTDTQNVQKNQPNPQQAIAEAQEGA